MSKTVVLSTDELGEQSYVAISQKSERTGGWLATGVFGSRVVRASGDTLHGAFDAWRERAKATGECPASLVES